MDDKLVIEQNALGSTLYVIGAITMSVLCAVLVVVDFRSMGNASIIRALLSIPGVYIVIKIILAFGIIFFGYAAFVLINRAKRKTVILQADINGITDNSSAISLGYIPWADVKRIYLDQLMGNQFIELELNENEKYLAKVGGLKRKTIETNLRMGHQAVCITLNSTGKNPQEVFTELQRIYLRSKESISGTGYN